MWTIQNTFVRGELTPKMHARSDTEHWKTSLARAVNVITMRHGGITRRPPFRDRGAARVNGAVRLIPFIFNESQSFICELSDGKMRVWSPISGLVSGILVDIPWPNESLVKLQFDQSGDVIFVTELGIKTHQIKRYSNTDFRIEPYDTQDGPYQKISRGKTLLQIDGTGNIAIGTPFGTSNNTDVVTPPTPRDPTPSGGHGANKAFDGDKNTWWTANIYDDAELGIELASPAAVCGYSIRSAPREYIAMGTTYGDGTPKMGDNGRPSFAAPRSWLFQAYDTVTASWITLDQQSGVIGWGEGESRYFKFFNEIKYLKYRIVVQSRNDSLDQREYCRISNLSLTGFGDDAGIVTISATPGVTEINAGRGFLASDIGRHIRIFHSEGSWAWGEIIEIVATNQIKARIRGQSLPASETVNVWRLGAWSDTSGFPSTVGFINQRLFLGANRESPQTMWGTQTADYYNHGISEPMVDTDAITLSLDQPGPIAFMREGPSLMIGTDGAARSLGPGDLNQSLLSPKSFKQQKHADVGFASVLPVNFGNVAIAIGRFGQVIREFKFVLEKSSFDAPSISILSEHLFRRGIIQMASVMDPTGICWFIDSDGHLISMMYETEQRQIAFNPHRIGNNGRVISIASIPTPSGDQLWAVINYNGEYRMQSMQQPYESGDDRKLFPYVDGYVLNENIDPSGEIAGLDYAIGAHVHVYSDGATESRLADDFTMMDAFKSPGVIRTNTVVGAGGVVDFDNGRNAGLVVAAGFPYFSGGETLRITFSQSGDSGLGRKSRCMGIILDVLDTGALYAWSPTTDAPTDMIMRDHDDLMDEAVPLFTGSVDPSYLSGSHFDSGQVRFGTCSPEPMTIRAINIDVEAE